MVAQMLSIAERVVFEANSDGVKLLTLGSFDSDLYVGFQQHTVGSADDEARFHIEINDQIRSAYVDEIAARIDTGVLEVEYKGDADDHLRTPKKLIRVGLPKTAELEAIAAIQAFFAETVLRS